MSFEYKELTTTVWSEVRNSINNHSIFGNLDYLTCFEKAYHFDKKLVAIYDGDHPYLLISFFVKKKQIVCPNYHFFQFVWEREDLSWRRLMIWEFLLTELKNKYRHIHFRLPISVNDVRIFEWEGFNYRLKHTYIKVFDDKPYHQNLKRILAKSNTYTYTTNTDWDKVWHRHEVDMRSFMLSHSFVANAIAYFKSLQQQKLITTYNIYKDGLFLSSIVAVVDSAEKKAYFPLIGKIDVSQSGASAHLYDYTLAQLKKEGIVTVDLYGANIKTIARFKHKFEPKLTTFFEVRYSARQNMALSLINNIKAVVKKVIR